MNYFLFFRLIFKDLINLQSLFMNNNKLQVIYPDHMESLQSLKVAILSYNNLSFSPFAYSEDTTSTREIRDYKIGLLFPLSNNLRQLFLDHNNMSSITNDMFYNNLEHVNIRGNNLSRSDVSFDIFFFFSII